MKYFAFLFTWTIQFIALRSTKEALGYFLFVTMICFFAGVIMNFLPDRQYVRTRKVGWGFFYGSLSFLALGLAFALWLSYLFSSAN